MSMVILVGATRVKVLIGWNLRRHDKQLSFLLYALCCTYTEDLSQFYPGLFWVAFQSDCATLVSTVYHLEKI